MRICNCLQVRVADVGVDLSREFIIIERDTMRQTITINDHLNVPRSELHFRFARSGGPGGQNVNKVETRVELLFDVAQSESLSEDQRRHVFEALGLQIDSKGILHVTAQESRSQWRNREIAVERFIRILQKALRPPKKRIATKTPDASKQKRLSAKKRRSEIKQLRKVREE